MDISAIPSEFLLAFFCLFIVAMLAGGIYLSVRQLRTWRQAILDRGLVVQTFPDEALVKAMLRFKSDTRLENVYRLDRGAYQVYLFKLGSLRSSSDDSARSYNNMALISPDFHLPRFMLAPKIHSRALGKFVEWALEKLVQSSGLRPIAFPESPVFDSEFVLLGMDEPDVRAYFDLARVNRLATAAKNFVVEGEGDLLTFMRGDLTNRSHSNIAQLDSLIEGAAVLYAIFRD